MRKILLTLMLALVAGVGYARVYNITCYSEDTEMFNYTNVSISAYCGSSCHSNNWYVTIKPSENLTIKVKASNCLWYEIK